MGDSRGKQFFFKTSSDTAFYLKYTRTTPTTSRPPSSRLPSANTRSPAWSTYSAGALEESNSAQKETLHMTKRNPWCSTTRRLTVTQLSYSETILLCDIDRSVLPSQVSSTSGAAKANANVRGIWSKTKLFRCSGSMQRNECSQRRESRPPTTTET